MGELYGQTKQNNLYSYGIQAVRALTHSLLGFQTARFVRVFNDLRQRREKDWLPDQKNTCANDTLRTLFYIGVLSNQQRGIYRFLDGGKKYAIKFNKVYPQIKKGVYVKKGEITMPKKAPINRTKSTSTIKKKEGLGLTKLGSANTEYEYDGPSADILETFDNKHRDQLYLVPFTQDRDEFSSRCPVTNQPDFAKMEIVYVPNVKMVESKSLKLYFFSFRNSGEFHEDVCNRIAKDLWSVLQPKYLRVFGNFAPRGGIAIKPIIEKWAEATSPSVFQQIKRLVDSWDRKSGKE